MNRLDIQGSTSVLEILYDSYWEQHPMDTEKIRKALEEKDYEHAFRFVHNLKGNSLNLDLTPLYKISDVLCEELRNGAPSRDVTPMLEQLENEYTRVVGLIRQIEQ